MTQHLHPDDHPNHQWRRFADDEEVRAVIPEFSFQDPVAVGMMFCNALDDPEANLVALSRLATPESLEAFGDFTEAAAFIASTPNVGYGSLANAAVGDEDVRYFKIMSGIQDSYQVLDEQIMAARGVATLVWRNEFSEWRVHGIGDYIRPEQVPH
jgi:hypothetical protein